MADPDPVQPNLKDLATISESALQQLNQLRERNFLIANELRTTINERVREDIRGAGNFGNRWTDGFYVETHVDDEGNLTVAATMLTPHWEVFQYGATITGKPWLYFAPKAASGGSPGFTMAKGRKGGLPPVIRKHQVTIPKKFHIFEIIDEEVQAVSARLRSPLP